MNSNCIFRVLHWNKQLFSFHFRDSKACWSDPVREGGGDVDGQPPHQKPEERRLFLQGEFCQKHGVERLHWIWWGKHNCQWRLTLCGIITKAQEKKTFNIQCEYLQIQHVRNNKIWDTVWQSRHRSMWKSVEAKSSQIQSTTAIVDTVIVESTAIVEQKPLTTQFYLLLVESPL